MFDFLKPKQNIIVTDCVRFCLKEKCPKWVVLYHTVKDEKGIVKNIQEGKCAMAWIPTLLTEIVGKLNATNKN